MGYPVGPIGGRSVVGKKLSLLLGFQSWRQLHSERSENLPNNVSLVLPGDLMSGVRGTTELTDQDL